MTPPPILPSSLRVGDRIEWTPPMRNALGRGDAVVTNVGASWCQLDTMVTILDRDAPRLAIRVVRRAK